MSVNDYEIIATKQLIQYSIDLVNQKKNNVFKTDLLDHPIDFSSHSNKMRRLHIYLKVYNYTIAKINELANKSDEDFNDYTTRNKITFDLDNILFSFLLTCI